MVCTGFQQREAPDREGHERQVIVFDLTPIGAFGTTEAGGESEEQLWEEPLSALRARAIAAPKAREPAERRRLNWQRSSAVRVYVLRRAGGVCEGCGQEAPFKTSAGRPYLEPQNLRRLSDGGPDDPCWVIALCPNCHCRAHYSADREQFTNRLVDVVVGREGELGHSCSGG